MSNGVGDMLRRLAGQAFGETTKQLAGPFLVDNLPDTYAVATDAKVIVWAKDWQPTLIPALKDDQQDIRAKLLMHFAPPKHLQASLPGRLAELRDFCGDPVHSISCPECKGASQESDYVSCSFCEGDGNVLPEPRPGFVYGISLNLNYLACVLEPFSGDTLIRIIPDPREEGMAIDQGSRLWIIAPEFRVVIMTLKAVTNPNHDDFELWREAPLFPETVKG